MLNRGRLCVLSSLTAEMSWLRTCTLDDALDFASRNSPPSSSSRAERATKPRSVIRQIRSRRNRLVPLSKGSLQKLEFCWVSYAGAAGLLLVGHGVIFLRPALSCRLLAGGSEWAHPIGIACSNLPVRPCTTSCQRYPVRYSPSVSMALVA